MATAVIERPLLRRVSWGALFAGFFVGFGIWFMLLTLIAAIGLSSVNPRDLGSWASLGEGLGVWGGIAGIIAVFCGAWCAARLSGTADRGEGMLHGATVWGLTLLVGLWMAAMAIGAAASGAASVAGGAASAAAKAAPAAAGSVDQGTLSKTLAAGVNDWMRSHGKQPIPPHQLQAAMNDVAGQAMRRAQQGNVSNAVDRNLIVSSLQRNTNLSRQDANEVAAQVQQEVQGAVSKVQQKAGDVGQAAASGGRAAAWGAFVGTVLTFIAALLGGALAITDERRRQLAAREPLVRGRPLEPQHA